MEHAKKYWEAKGYRDALEKVRATINTPEWINRKASALLPEITRLLEESKNV